MVGDHLLYYVSFHFPHKSIIPLPVKVGRLSADSGVEGDRKRETEVPSDKPFNGTIYTAGRAAFINTAGCVMRRVRGVCERFRGRRRPERIGGEA